MEPNNSEMRSSRKACAIRACLRGRGFRRKLVVAAASVVTLTLLVCTLWVVLAPTAREWLVAVTSIFVILLSQMLILWWIVDRTSSSLRTTFLRTRKDASRHEWMQEKSLRDLERSIGLLQAEVLHLSLGATKNVPDQLSWNSTARQERRVLFVTSNGSGMGHITRCIAIAEAGRERFAASILTLSVASALAHEAFPYISSFQSPDAFPGRRELWHRKFADLLISIAGSDRPDAVVFDGTVIYSGLQDACRAARLPIIWIRRGLWKADVDRTQYSAANLYADHLIVPADIGEECIEDKENESTDVVAPVVVAERSNRLDRRRAIAALGLDSKERYCLVQVGSASVPGVDDLPGFICRQLATIDPSVRPVVLESPVGRPTGEPGVTVIKNVYPLARYLGAFEYAVVAAGYNTVHECVQMCLPALYVPKMDTVTDDQCLRADNIRRLGLGLTARTELEIGEKLRELSEPERRAELTQKCSEVPTLDGAEQAAIAISDFLARFSPDHWAELRKP